MNTLRILEISWLVFALISAGLFFYNLASEGLVSALWPLLVTLVASMFYYVRRKQRIAYEKHLHEKTQTR
jgi:hypothetical protein